MIIPIDDPPSPHNFPTILFPRKNKAYKKINSFLQNSSELSLEMVRSTIRRRVLIKELKTVFKINSLSTKWSSSLSKKSEKSWTTHTTSETSPSSLTSITGKAPSPTHSSLKQESSPKKLQEKPEHSTKDKIKSKEESPSSPPESPCTTATTSTEKKNNT